MSKYLDEIIYGGMDGILTTVSIIAGAYGSNISMVYAFILGIANLLADGFSMGISRYLSLADLDKNKTNAIYRGVITFLAFCLFGFIPIASLFICGPDCNGFTKDSVPFMIATIASFIYIGYLKSKITKTTLYTIFETLVIGCIGVSISYYVSVTLKGVLIQ